MLFNNNNNNNSKYEQNFVKIDQYILEINNVITKICKEQILKTTDDRRVDIDDRRVDIVTDGDIQSVYDTAIISVIHKFITISNECKKIYLEECSKAGIEADRLR
jgi:hypothetical protein